MQDLVSTFTSLFSFKEHICGYFQPLYLGYEMKTTRSDVTWMSTRVILIDDNRKQNDRRGKENFHMTIQKKKNIDRPWKRQMYQQMTLVGLTNDV